MIIYNYKKKTIKAINSKMVQYHQVKCTFILKGNMYNAKLECRLQSLIYTMSNLIRLIMVQVNCTLNSVYDV